jgi:poly-gamma-glutamate synthesis protein (capsule biosynthesis protein)
MKKLCTILLFVLTIFALASCSPSSAYLEETTHQAARSTDVTDDTESDGNAKIESIVTVSPNKNEDLTPIEDIKTIIITAAGDCTLGTDESFAYTGSFMDEFEKQNKDYGYFFKNVKDIFSNDDLTIVNLETTLTTATKKADKQFRFKGLPEFTEIIKAGDIETVNIANNHTMDYLEKGYSDTIENLKAAEIGFFGNNHIYTTTIKGIKIGLLGYKGWSNGDDVKNQIKTDIENLKEDNCQLVIVNFHWGIERDNYPNSVQKDLGRFAIDNGADLVLGHHPHVIQGIEKYKDKYIVYSLGNFCFGGNRNPSDKDTFIFQQTFEFKNGEKVNNDEINIIPCSVSSVKSRNNYQPTPVYDEEAERILKRIEEYSKEF